MVKYFAWLSTKIYGYINCMVKYFAWLSTKIYG